MTVRTIESTELDRLLLPLRVDTPPTPEVIGAFVADARTRPELLLSQAEFSDIHPYGRRMLVGTSWLEVLVMGFRAGSTCPPHDHGTADGLVLVLAGTAEHVTYRRTVDGPVEIERSLHGPGALLDAPTECVHAMGSPGPDPLVTLHIYRPPIQCMTIYDMEHRRIYEVNGNAGAWLPPTPGTIISCAAFGRAQPGKC